MKELQDKQKALDNIILAKLDEEISTEEIIVNTIAGLIVELGEFANELEFFKHWKKNKGKGNEKEEFADCIHMILSLANQYDYDMKLDLNKFDTQHNMSSTFMHVISSITIFYKTRGQASLNCALEGILKIAKSLGWTEDDIKEIFNEKSTKIIERQILEY